MWFSPENLVADQSLVIAAKQDPEKFLPLYNKYCAPILAYCQRRLPERPDAEDICAEVFVDAMRQMKRYRFQGLPVIVWLYKIAAGHIAAYYRKSYKHPEVDLEGALENSPSPEPTALEQLHEKQKRQIVQAALSQLPERQQMLLTLKYHAGLSNLEIGKQLGLGEAAVKMQYYRALKKLRHQLQDLDHVS